ncbi:hypothetical protein [Calothrix sp. PCC 7507]|uniref:hypothetical protein n=1 Tax=Calothrix sp. PCC 7507 TaxID=99598 RepID=UPI00029F0AFF|nr:hypothetical protein [Calothrix sp. PCC 7507]AFY31769.1 hypothetical protein Cal7507_1298 [Calothrix sp. PCC 7507]
MPRFVGWGATHVGGFPDLSEVAFEARNPTNTLGFPSLNPTYKKMAKVLIWRTYLRGMRSVAQALYTGDR